MRIFAVPVVFALLATAAMADHHENPLAEMMQKMGGVWRGDFQMGPVNGTMHMESDWAAGKKAVESEWHAEVNGEKVASGKGLAYWNPEKKRIEAVDVDSEGTVSFSHVVKSSDHIMETKITKVIGGTGMFKAGMTAINDFEKMMSVVKSADGAEVFKMTNIRKVDADEHGHDDDEDHDDEHDEKEGHDDDDDEHDESE